MLLMLIDHVRETVYLHLQVGDPVDVTTTSPSLFVLRLLSGFCAPAFVLLAGLGAFIYQHRDGKKRASFFLFTRGLFLIVLEIFVIGFAWTGKLPPEKFYLQVIWCIGICMICLSGLIYLPRISQIAISLIFIAGHNLLDQIRLSEGHPFYYFWAILHQRDWIELFGVPARTSYPVLPWIGVILLGYLLGSWFTKADQKERMRSLLWASCASLVGFFILRGINVYGDRPWIVHESMGETFLGFFALTKYPASLAFLMFTLPFTGFCLWAFERFQNSSGLQLLSKFGSGSMFFYVVHLYVLKGLYLLLVSQFGLNHGHHFGVNHPIWILTWAAGLSIPLCWLTVKFLTYKERHRNLKWLSYL